MRLLVAPVALLIALALVPPASAEPTQTVPFTLLPGLTQTYEATIPARGHVWIEIVVLSGATTDVAVDGPGACAGASVSPEMGSASAPSPPVTVDCGDLLPTNTELSIGVFTGLVRGYMVLHGIHVNDG